MSQIDRDARLKIMEESDMLGCACGAPLPLDFLDNPAWHAEIAWKSPDEGVAEVICPACLQGPPDGVIAGAIALVSALVTTGALVLVLGH